MRRTSNFGASTELVLIDYGKTVAIIYHVRRLHLGTSSSSRRSEISMSGIIGMVFAELGSSEFALESNRNCNHIMKKNMRV